jgi:hypothetical protein
MGRKKRPDADDEENRARSEELLDSIIRVAHTTDTKTPEWYKDSLEASRLLFRRGLPLRDCEERKLTVEVASEGFTLDCTYYKEHLDVTLSLLFDSVLALTPSEVKSRAERYGRQYEELSRVLGNGYRNDMVQCLNHAGSLFESKLPEILRDAFDELCFEVVASTIRDLQGKLSIDVGHNGLFEAAIRLGEENKKRRLRPPGKGKPKGSGPFKNKGQLEWALICAMRFIRWQGKEITQPAVVSFFKDCPTLPRCTDERVLRRWMGMFGISWGKLVEENQVVPDWYAEMLNEKVGKDATGQ